MAVKFTIDKGGSTSTPIVPRYVPSYAAPAGKTTTQVAKTNALAVKTGVVPKPTNVTTGSRAGLPAAATTPTYTTSTPSPSSQPVPVSTTPEVGTPGEPIVSAPIAEEQAPQAPAPAYNVYEDPFYQQALQGAQSQFNLARADAEASRQYEERGINRQLEDRRGTAEQARRRLAGNYAARGMGGGRAGALTRAEAETNARELTMRTGLREQIAELGRQFTSNFGAPGTDWLGTRAGMQAQQSALQQALQNRLGGLTTVG